MNLFLYIKERLRLGCGSLTFTFFFPVMPIDYLGIYNYTPSSVLVHVN